jgi:CubicO group peptidase (beta-lactamase class C family)
VAGGWRIPGAPPESFFARGLLGQYIAVVPAEQLVVARFGVTHTSGADIVGMGRLLVAAIVAVKGDAADSAPHPDACLSGYEFAKQSRGTRCARERAAVMADRPPRSAAQ